MNTKPKMELKISILTKYQNMEYSVRGPKYNYFNPYDMPNTLLHKINSYQ